jgi:hypothetical protein
LTTHFSQKLREHFQMASERNGEEIFLPYFINKQAEFCLDSLEEVSLNNYVSLEHFQMASERNGEEIFLPYFINKQAEFCLDSLEEVSLNNYVSLVCFAKPSTGSMFVRRWSLEIVG